MSDQHPGQSDDPYGDAERPQNPYGQPAESPYGQPQPPQESPYGQPQQPQPPPYGQAPESPYGQAPQAPYGQAPSSESPYAQAQPAYGQPSDKRPGTVTAGAWIAIAMSALTALLLLFVALMLVVAKDAVIDEMEKQPEFRDLDLDPNSVVGVIVAVVLVFALWSVIGVVLGIFTLRRSNVARILLVVSSAVVAVFSLLSIATGGSALNLVAAIATIVLLFIGGANDWFSRKQKIDFRGMGGADGPYRP